MDLHFLSVSQSMMRLVFFYFFEKLFEKKMVLEFLFILVFLKENKIRNENHSATPYLEKDMSMKSSPNSEVILPIEKIR